MFHSLRSRARVFGLAIAGLGVASIASTSSAQSAFSTKKEPRTVGGVQMYGVAGEPEFFKRGRLFIDADGAPNAYHPGFKCDSPSDTGWKLPTNLACASKTTPHECSGFGFDGHVEDGEVGTVVHCRWRHKGCVAEVPSRSSKRRQGGCVADKDSHKGLDALANAGAPGNWYGILTDRHGQPVVQKAGDPFPGFYISTTSLADPSKHETDPLRYLDSNKINFVALPPHTGAQPGDLVVVVNWPTKKIAYAVFGDGGSPGYFEGEGSIALAGALGLGTSLHSGGTDKHDIVFLVFPGKHLEPRFPKSQLAIDMLGIGTFTAWGGLARLEALQP